MKRSFDLILSFLGLLILFPILSIFTLLVWLQDFNNPFYFAPRIGRKNKVFFMVKLRSMVMKADKKGGESTSKNDSRITPIGSLIRKYKLDEFTQLWNVLIGEMSLVGPRPNTKKGISVYTKEEKNLLTVRPGITDFSSIVFSDEGEILSKSCNPDEYYDELIRPWKSRLGLIYIENQSVILDIKLIFFTLVTIFSRDYSLRWISKYLKQLGSDQHVVAISRRKIDLYPIPPPGS